MVLFRDEIYVVCLIGASNIVTNNHKRRYKVGWMVRGKGKKRNIAECSILC